MAFISRRRTFLVNKNLQFRLLCITLGYVIFFLLILSLALFAPLMANLKAEGGKISKEALESANNLIFLHNNFWLPSLLCLVFIAIHSVRTSHRIAGPMYRLNMLIESIKQGILPAPLSRLRKGDYLTEEFSNVNEMLDNLRLKLNDIRASHEDLDMTLSQCSELSGKGSLDEMRTSLNEIRAKSARLKEKIGYFSVLNGESPGDPSHDATHICSEHYACAKEEDGTSGGEC
jgi:methyl-accepting chemotaxis protein